MTDLRFDAISLIGVAVIGFLLGVMAGAALVRG